MNSSEDSNKRALCLPTRMAAKSFWIGGGMGWMIEVGNGGMVRVGEECVGLDRNPILGRV